MYLSIAQYKKNEKIILCGELECIGIILIQQLILKIAVSCVPESTRIHGDIDTTPRTSGSSSLQMSTKQGNAIKTQISRDNEFS